MGRLVEHSGPPSPHAAVCGQTTVTPTLLSAGWSDSCGPVAVAPWNAWEVQRCSLLPHRLGAVAMTLNCTFDPGFSDIRRSDSVLRCTSVLRRSGAFGPGRDSVNPGGGDSWTDCSIVPGAEAFATLTSNVVDWPAVVYAG